MVKFPNVHVQLSGADGNTMMLLAQCTLAMKKAKVPLADINHLREWVLICGSYDEALDAMRQTVDVS